MKEGVADAPKSLLAVTPSWPLCHRRGILVCGELSWLCKVEVSLGTSRNNVAQGARSELE